MKKVFLIGFTLMCFASMAGCKTKPPKVAHPYVQEYVAGREHGKLGPITPRNFYDYMTYGWQVNTGTEESKNQAAFVTQVLDIYENSYDFDK